MEEVFERRVNQKVCELRVLGMQGTPSELRVLGMQGTPSFIIVKNDGSKPETLLGAQPFPSFQSVIDEKSKK